uniref:Uncharacterized protein n=1 Tax=Vespula pensylvanica TaxID=30213 RepID=A0A834UF40_VESPE|nr:hypothetical protein H0235_003226 [Vespula pensylvanica]
MVDLRNLRCVNSVESEFNYFGSYHAPKVIVNHQDTLQNLQKFNGKDLGNLLCEKLDRLALQSNVIYYPDLSPASYVDNPIKAVITRFIKIATNKMYCLIFYIAWTPEGRHLITDA